MKLYTKTGDDGTTGLIGGARVEKSCEQIEAIGAVDELNAALGLARSRPGSDELAALLADLQQDMFNVGATLARNPANDKSAPDDRNADDPTHLATRTHDLEVLIDCYTDRLPPLERFILPGGCESASRLHHARAVCRRAERRCVRLTRNLCAHYDAVLIYLNRLSDLLFVLAREANRHAGVPDIVWEG